MLLNNIHFDLHNLKIYYKFHKYYTLSNQNRRIIMGANGVKKAHEYSIDKIKDMWLEILK